MSSKDLELTLDSVPIEYPALVKEAVLNIHRTEVSSNCASLNEKYCWFLSKSQMLIWERLKSTSHRSSIPTQLPIPTSGLLQSTRCVVVYDGAVQSQKSKTVSTGVLVVSPEGVLRHWASIDSQNYTEAILELNSEVVLKVELVDPPTEDKFASFILTTTSGTVYFLSIRNGVHVAHKIAGKESQGIRRRLSSIMFGGPSKECTSLVSNSFQFWCKKTNELLVVCVSPDVLTVFNVPNRSEIWSLKTKDFFLPIATNYLESDLQSKPFGVKCRLIDVAPFRDGIMVFMSAHHQSSNLLSLFLVYISPDWTTEVPLDSSWSARVPLPDAKSLFCKTDDSIYSSLSLCIPQRTAQSQTSERTDGLFIVHPFFVMSMFVPDDLENSKQWELSLFNSLSLSINDQLIGIANTKQYLFVLMMDAGVSTVRLLPRGFTDTSMIIFPATNAQRNQPSTAVATEDWAILSELLSEMVASGLPKTVPLQALYRAFELFGDKDMVKSNNELKAIKSLTNSELASIVEQFLHAIIDYSDAVNKAETELHAKKVLTGRLFLFLKHMGLYEKIASANIPNSRLSGVVAADEHRTGLTMLAEMNERVATAEAIWTWRGLSENNGAIFDSVLDKILRTVPEVQELGLSDKDSLFGKVGMVHHIPHVAYAQLIQVMEKSKSNKFEVFHSIAEMFIAIKESILESRRTKYAIAKSRGWWTMDKFAMIYRKLCQKILEELKDGLCSESERTRLMSYVMSLYDFYLGETDTQPDSDQILLDIIYLGRVTEGLALAEKHKDFGVLVKITLQSDKTTRQKSLNRLKKHFENDDFEMYLCQYLRKHGLTHVLMEQRGERVDAYLDNFKELRYEREISNKQYAKAAYTLMTLADSEVGSFSKFADYLTRANFCARAADPGDEGVEEVLEFYRRRLPEMKHRRQIPNQLIMSAYGDDLDVMMSVDEMIEWNLSVQSSDEKTIDGFIRALYLLADLIKVEDSPELQKLVRKVWTAVLDVEEWPRIKNRDELEKNSIFGKVTNELMYSYPNLKGSGFPHWIPVDRLLIIPEGSVFDSILKSIQFGTKDGKHASWIKAHIKFTVEQLKKRADVPKVAFYRPDTENVGSFTSTALHGFKPILEMREQRHMKVIDVNAMEA